MSVEVRVVSLVVMLSAPLGAQQGPPPQPAGGPDVQNWDELDVRTRISSRIDATWVTQIRLSSQLQNPAIFVVGADVNVAASKHIVVTPSYYYFAFRGASGSGGHGHNPIVATTLSTKYRGLTISDRNRLIGVLGTRGTRNFWVYANRPAVARDIGPRDWQLSLFVWDEVFYFSNHGGWTRNRFAIGARKAFSERTTASWYYERQNDRYSRPSRVNVVAAAIELRVN